MGQDTRQPDTRIDRDLVMMHDRQRMFVERHVYPRQAAQRAADEIERQPPVLARPAFLGERRPYPSFDLLGAVAPNFGDPQHTERQRALAADLALGDPDQFEAAAAQIGDDAAGVGDRR